MSWPDFAQMSDDELRAICLYLKSVAPRPTDSRFHPEGVAAARACQNGAM
jgi:hypothetical protein